MNLVKALRNLWCAATGLCEVRYDDIERDDRIVWLRDRAAASDARMSGTTEHAIIRAYRHRDTNEEGRAGE